MMNLYEKFRFDAPTSDPDGFGGTVDGWTEGPTVRTHLRNLRGSETVIAARLQGVQPVVLTIRASNATELIDPSWRAVDVRTGDEYNIRSIVRTDDRRYLELTAERGVTV